ncbi:MAG: PilN domain-containing protein [gamma proteobacterium symbiont of Taylorina sp.]|nr:PilN domain-containing protein [gamma proteobacterium symbiont of Taylorina sp.]
MFKNVMPFFHRLKHRFVFSLTAFFKTDERQELLKTVDTHLLIWNQELLNLQTGECVELADMEAETVASAAKKLSLIEGKNKQSIHIALYLSNVEFVATEYELPEMAIQNVPSALSYQVSDLMPAYPGQLMLAVNHNESRKKNIALWLDYERTERLFSAFKQQSIELSAIIPRIILTSLIKTENTKKNQILQYREQDENHLLQVTLNQQDFIQWRSISHRDMQDEAYFQQWEKESAALDDMTHIKTADYWLDIDRKQIEQLSYAFFPESARRNLKKHSRLKKGRLAVIAGLIVAVLLVTPFIKNSIRFNKYEQRYLEYKEKTVEVRKMRSSVTQFEDNWALFVDYPRADIAAVIRKLNSIIPKNSWIKGFVIKEGFVEIDGYSPNPTSILETISRQEEFEQVAFNRRTQSERGKKNEHFGITFHIKSINVEAYQEKYFPVN